MRFKYSVLFFCILALSYFKVAFGFSEITEIDTTKIDERNLSVNFIFENKASYKIYSLENPNRLVLDLKDAKLATSVSQFPRNDLVNIVRIGKPSSNILRFVLELKTKVHYKDFVTVDSNTNITSLQVKISLDNLTKDVVKNPDAINNDSVPVLKPVVPLPSQTNLRNIIIIIDPGHGGKDPGTIGLHGTREKDIVLKVAKDLQQILNGQYGFKAILTRDDDYFISLRQRLNIAHKNYGDMFIAIHADAYKDIVARGVTIFALSLRGATSEAARWLAQKENESELGHVLANKDQVLKSVLLNLAQTASIRTSLEIGQSIFKQLPEIANIHHHAVEQAAFVVLKNPDMPSLLVETGFLSNTNEELELRDPEYQHKLAYAIAAGIVNYFNHHPLPNTFVANKQNS